MAHSAALRPFGFSQPTRVTTKPPKRVDTPIPPDDSDSPVYPSTGYRSSRSHRVSLSKDSLGTYWPTSSPTHTRAAEQRSGLSQRNFPDEEDDDTVQPTRHSRTHEKRRLTRIQPSRHAHNPSSVSPNTPTATKKLADLQLRFPPPELPAIRERFPEKQLQEQIKEVYLALRRVEDEREEILSQMKAGRADQCRVERELDETRRENQCLIARLEEMLRSSKMKSSLIARSDDGWGCSMYDMDGEGH